jgi:hypothetical protein
VGGYAFGFSPYMLAHLLGHLTVLMMFPVPQNGLVLTSPDNGEVLVGVMAARETLDALVEKYRPYATRAEIAPLATIAGWAESTRSILLLEYGIAQLPKAAAMAYQRETAERRPVLPAPTSLSVGSK